MNRMSRQRFPLAPMSRSISFLTAALFLLPTGFLYLGIRRGSPPLAVGLFIAALYLLVWLYFRPMRFEISSRALTIVWPIRSLRLPLAEITAVEAMTSGEFRHRYGRGMRVGAGGLWGGFGLLLTPRETFRFYISRLDGYVLVHSRVERPLLLTPDRPEEFLETLRSYLDVT